MLSSANPMRRVHLALLGLLCVTSACSSLPLAGSDRDLTVSEGSTFQVVVSGRSGTGHAWQVDGGEETIQPLRLEPVVQRAHERPDAIEEETFVFLARLGNGDPSLPPMPGHRKPSLYLPRDPTGSR